MTKTAVYDEIGNGYVRFRRPDPRIEAAIVSALGNATTVVDVGAGTGSYEPEDRHVVAVEPSARMAMQRPTNAAPCLRGDARSLPFYDRSFDAAMAVLTLHHWPEPILGLRELSESPIASWCSPSSPRSTTRSGCSGITYRPSPSSTAAPRS